jgi:dipeptidyl-peptidase-4
MGKQFVNPVLALGLLLTMVHVVDGRLEGAEKKPVTLDDVGKHSLVRPVSPVWSPDDKRFAYMENDHLYVFEIASKTKRDLIALATLEKAAEKAPEAEVFDWTNRRVSEAPVQWFSKQDRLLVSSAGDLFTVSLSSAADGGASFEQLTHTPTQEYDPKLSPDDRYVSFRREHDLFVLEVGTKAVTRLTTNGTSTLLNAQLDWVYPEELDLGSAHWWSPDSKRIAYLQLDTHDEPVFPQVSLLNPAAVMEPERFPKPGDPNANVRLGVVAVTGGPTTWMDLGETQDHLLARVTWMPDSTAVTAMRLNRIQNKLDLIRADALTGVSTVLIHEEDPYWINVKDEPYFFKNGKEFIWESERDGFRHFYLYNANGKLISQITKGEWEVERLITVDDESRKIYFASNEHSPVESDLYEFDLKKGREKQLTAGSGMHNVSVSPHGEYFTDVLSNLTSPPSQVLRAGDGHALMTWMAPDTSVQDSFTLSIPEVVQVPGGAGETFYARLIRPVPFDPAKKYPVIVEVYGGPGVQTVHNAWGGVNMEQVYAANGFLVWQMDNRGSSGRGHKWESAIFRNMGFHELEDQKAGVEFLKRYSFVDPTRIGLTGWSYGGYMTLYSLVNAPDLFQAGVAGAPVTDWRDYDSIYTERYMGLPGSNATGYEQSSPQTHASNLKAKLLILHNIEDDNVHFANTLQMAAALERENKQFRMVVYPLKSHGVFGPYAKNLGATTLSFFQENLK